MNYVFNEECNSIIRVDNELMKQYNITNNNEEQLKVISKRISKADTKFCYGKCKAKVIYGCFTKTLEKDQRIDHSSSKSWSKNQKFTSHFEGYISAMEQDAKDGKEPPRDNNVVYVRQCQHFIIHQ